MRPLHAPTATTLAGLAVLLATTRSVATDPPRLEALLVNGGRDAAANYQSHLLHVRQLVALLRDASIPAEAITVFSGDGEDPAADLSLRESQPEREFWLIGETRVGRSLRTPVTRTSSAVDGIHLHPATREGLAAWIAAARDRLRPGDTLLLYVTDHGTRGDTGPDDNRIVLWGKDETLSARELREQLAVLGPGVRVVLLMSQCYSGGFARTGVLPQGGGWKDTVCGYLSSTADRPAYGCYPENRGRENVGHSFEFLRALAATRRFSAAHARVLVADRTPDVPHRLSDAYLEELLQNAARRDGRDDWISLVDELLRAAWEDRGRWEPEIRLLDAIARAYGVFSPRSLGEIEAQSRALPEISTEYRGFARAWRGGLADATASNLARFARARPRWGRRLADERLRDLPAPRRARLTAALLRDLVASTATDRTVWKRLRRLRRNAELADGVAYRMEVRAGVALRMRALLVQVAGRMYLDARGLTEDRERYQALVACEDVRLDDRDPEDPASADHRPAFPAYDDDIRIARDVQPAWIGISFREASDERKQALGLGDGAAEIVAVYPDSPAVAAGLRAGDVVLGPRETPFTEKNQIRVWTMFSRVDEPRPLLVRRDEDWLALTLVPKPFPRKWPDLPGPTKVGEPAPALDVQPYRGTPPASLADGRERLLFFWATWCGPCKAALPELVAFGAERGIQVIAVTDEAPAKLDAFFHRFQGPFPAAIATDEPRRTFIAYGVSGTPTFVLLDGAGKVAASWTGYSVRDGLRVPGWRWAATAPARQ